MHVSAEVHEVRLQGPEPVLFPHAHMVQYHQLPVGPCSFPQPHGQKKGVLGPSPDLNSRSAPLILMHLHLGSLQHSRAEKIANSCYLFHSLWFVSIMGNR